MTLEQYKMPIITGLTDLPSEEGDPTHPNASLFFKQYNDLIDNLPTGSDGQDGRGITNTSYNPSTGVVTFTFSDNTTFNTGDLRGANGANGTNGTNGTNGVSPTVTVLTQSQYNALAPNYNNNTFYVING
jgi:hypothetical protein